MGRRPGEPLERLAEAEVIDVRREALGDITRADVVAEGFPETWHPVDFVAFYCDRFGGTPQQIVTRIEWRYIS